MSLVALGLLALAAGAAPPSLLVADAAKSCEACAEWNLPQDPFRVFGNTWYVGTRGLSAILVAGEAGLVLIDGGLPQSAPLIAANIRSLGFDLRDVRLILNSHAHYDHAGGIAALQRASGAVVAASARGAEALHAGHPTRDDPQFALPDGEFPAVSQVRLVRDGERLELGDLALTAHFTPGHTPGGTSWSWRSCEGARCLDIAYADSLTAVSAPGFRFGGDEGRTVDVERFESGLAAVRRMPCDVLLTPHPGFAQIHEKRLRRDAGDADAFLSPGGCRAYSAAARAQLAQRLGRERRERP